MFGEPLLPESIGLAPVWKLVVRDSGRRVDVLTNRFRGGSPRLSFPLDGVELRRWSVLGNREEGKEMVIDAGVAVVPVRRNGELDSTEIRWRPGSEDSESEPRHFAGMGPIPRDGTHYCLSRDGRFLLVLRLMPHAVNVHGESGQFGLLDYFDVSNPKRPRRVGPTLEADGPLDNGTVSDDGSRVAVAIIYPDTLPRNHTRVVTFKRAGRGLTAPRIVVPATTVRGLQLAGRFLFVGMQRPPLPVFVQTSTTDTLSVYDLGD